MNPVRPLALALFLAHALAQVGLLDGPRPPTEVRGTLQGNPRDGYKVVVEFLVDQGVEPVQGTVYRALTWDGRLYLCPGACDTFRLAGYTRGALYSRAVFDLYDSQGRFRGRAGVDTVYDAQNRPVYYRVDYAVSPLQGTRVWRPSPDNPVPVEAGGWLWATPPGGVSPERYRYPGLEGYQPPGGGSVFASLSPADRDVVEVLRVDSLALLRQAFGRAARGSVLYLYVPEVSPWTQRLAQEWASQVGGEARFVVPEGTARAYCATSARRDRRYHVMPRASLPPEQSLGVAYPPSGEGQPGMVLAGAGLYRDPGWPETDYVNFTTALVPLTEGLPQARARVWGYISRADLKARVEFYERVLSSSYNRYASGSVEAPWDGAFTADVGAGVETFRLRDWREGDYANALFYAQDDQGRDRAFVYVTTRKETVYELDTSRPHWFSGVVVFGGPEGVRFSLNGETFELYGCSFSRWNGYRPAYACRIRDLAGRHRGEGEAEEYILGIHQVSGTVYPLVARTRTRYTYSAYIRGWVEGWRPASDNDRPVQAGGVVYAEGRGYRIPGMEAYLQPGSATLEVAFGNPAVSYLTRRLNPSENPYEALKGQGVQEAGAGPKPLLNWCVANGL
ncbi:hypothetical protein Theos_2537 (plasmid) [Thermus oshimai JL-2]|uniref:Uncharacterized protein n=1 Tax=Thermus oshimai JL-2 TaxID=751945 RepID=K7R8S9_THEOS|nr:hypothetical protein [Thermus oshimai]AFV77509.1 hypothetical protein Theos_2537 [Thermus oshimai JL-2]